jgi:hypothetical protein
MKAEQRKELETNTLADKMGQVVQRVKTGQRRTFLTYVIVTVALIVAAWLGYRWYNSDRSERSLQWLKLYDGSGNHIDELTQEKDSYAGKAARLQVAWFAYWDFGTKMMASNKDGAMQQLKKSADLYGTLAEDCKDDKVFEPQALLGRAVAQESRAVQDRDHLKKAKDYYEELVKKYEKSAEAEFARKRLEILKDDSKRGELSATYKELQGLLGIPAPLEQRPELKGFGGFPGLPPDKKQP